MDLRGDAVTLQEFYQLLKTTGLQVAYRGFKELPPPPFIVYKKAFSRDLIFGGQNMFKVGHYQIELYTVAKDPVSEAKIEAALKAAKIPYQSFEAELPTEDLMQVVYTVVLPGL